MNNALSGRTQPRNVLFTAEIPASVGSCTGEPAATTTFHRHAGTERVSPASNQIWTTMNVEQFATKVPTPTTRA